MFKIVANVGEWQTLYVAPSASPALRRFIPEKVSYERGAIQAAIDGRFMVERVLFSNGGQRPRVILLISENGIGLEVSNRIRSELMDQLKAIISRNTLSDSVEERSYLEEYCGKLDVMVRNQVDEQESINAKIRKSAGIAKMLAVGALLSAIIVPAIFFWATRNIKPVNGSSNEDFQLQIDAIESKIARVNSQLIDQQMTLSNLGEQITEMAKKSLSATSFRVTLKNYGKDKPVAWETRTYFHKEKFGSSIVDAWIEFSNPNTSATFETLNASSTDSNQIKIEYRSAFELDDDIEVTVHVLYRE